MSSADHDYTLVASSVTWNRLREHLLGNQAERMAFGYCSAGSYRGRIRLRLHDVVFPSDEEYSEQRAARVALRAADTIPYLIRAKGAAAFLDAHSHPFADVPCPSITDTNAASRQFVSLQGPSPGAALVRIIMSADGRVWADVHTEPDTTMPVQQIQVLHREGLEVVVPVNSGVRERNSIQDIDDRTKACLGEYRLSIMRRLSVGLVGLGGVGSMVARLLAGVVGELILIDPDHLEPHNAPRVWFAGARSRGSKVGAAKRALQMAFPQLRVRRCADSFPSLRTTKLLAAVDFLFVCPDHNAVRYSASRFAAAGLLPLIEVGCGGRTVNGELSALGYHIRLQVPGGPCLTCNGLDLGKLEDPSTTELKKRQEYIDDGEMIPGELAPLTTRAAADAVDVFHRYCTGYPGSPPLQLYSDSLNLKTLDLSESYHPQTDCPICGMVGTWPPKSKSTIMPYMRRGRNSRPDQSAITLPTTYPSGATKREL